MTANFYTRVVLTVTAILLAVLALRPLVNPTPVSAQSNSPWFYVEPGTTIIRSPDGTRQVEGKMIIDLRNGNIWGYPTGQGLPYPVDVGKNQPPVSTPILLGSFDLSKMK